MMGRYILPWFGGTPAVWSVCMLFFQCILLGGYAYAHWVGSLKSTKTQTSIHVGLLVASLLLLPVAPNPAWKPAGDDNPELRILILLLASVGGPYFLLSSTTPLLQRWFTLSGASGSGWRLYALSNFGSFLALFSYPFLMEPFLRLQQQSWIWTAGYVGFVGVCGATAWSVRGRQNSEDRIQNDAVDLGRPSVWDVVFWLGLAATASTLLLATTNMITQDIAVAPFLWILPLSIYLLSFILTFESDRWYRRMLFAILVGILAPVSAATASAGFVFIPLWGEAAVYLVTLFAVCMLCHGELAFSRPSAKYLTAFYLIVSAGGVLGGVLVALIAPNLFKQFTEYPLGLAATCVLGMIGWFRSGAMGAWVKENFAVRIPMMAMLFGTLGAVALAVLPNVGKTASDIVRNFFGILWVVERTDQAGDYRQLTHGRIKHGAQYAKEPLRSQPTTYFGPHGGVGVVMTALQQEKPAIDIGVIGLGAGTMAAWGRPGDTMHFYEINPDDEAVARKWFTYLSGSRAKVDVALGDARIVLEREIAAGRKNDFDILVVDAFSSDAIPVHLITEQCADLYKQRLKPGGLLMVHISNRSLNLEPIVRGVAEHLGWNAYNLISRGYAPTGEDGSKWILVTGDEDFTQRTNLQRLVSGWTPEKPLLWTDDFSSLWHVMMW